MVSLNSTNPYEIRNLLFKQVKELANVDEFKYAFLKNIELIDCTYTGTSSDKIYLRCAASGFMPAIANDSELTRILGQSSSVDGTPMPWVTDIWSVFGIKLAVENTGDTTKISKFGNWVNDFLPQQIRNGSLNSHEQAIANYIIDSVLPLKSSPVIALYLHYKDVLAISDTEKKKTYIKDFLSEFQVAYSQSHSQFIQALFVYVFDKINKENATVPPNLWSQQDIITFLERLPAGLKRWTWEDQARTRNSRAVKWIVENEYHVQNLLYVMLGAIFPDVSDEIHTAPVGQKNPRIDLYLPSIDTVIEVKYKKDTKKSFQDLIGEVAEDDSLYRSDPKFKKSKLIVFLWDQTRATEEHTKFKEGVTKLSGIDGCIVVCSPSSMDLTQAS